MTHSVSQSLAVSGSVLIAFIGLCHEFVGSTIFPWFPEALGGPIVWHFMGIAGFIIGVSLVLGTLRLARVPVVLLSALMILVGVGVTIFAAVKGGQFHFFAVSVVFAAIVVIFCHRSAEPVEFSKE